ncbi:hypothetical protein FB451DRAFT_1317864, partial [Mycena latifolia]
MPNDAQERSANQLDLPKVSADLPNNVAMDAPVKKPTRETFPLPHRGRDKLATMRETNRKKIMEAPSRAIFWKEIKRLADPKPAPISVTAESLKDVFEKRLNPPEVLPEQFDSAQHKINKFWRVCCPRRRSTKLRKVSSPTNGRRTIWVGSKTTCVSIHSTVRQETTMLCNECVGKN